MSEAQKKEWYAKSVEDDWQRYLENHPGTPRPVDEFVRFVSFSEWPEQHAECLSSEFGVDADGNAKEGSVEFDAAKEDMGLMDLYGYRCDVMYPVDPVSEQPLTDSQLEYLYWYETTELTECVAQFGVLVEDPPSLSSYKEQTRDDGEAWNPMAHVDEIDSDDYETLLETCQQTPEGLYG
ncbi:MAG: hypothetical protein ACK5LO_08830 [Leucobacter sp.]